MVIQIEFLQSKKEAILNEKYLKSGKSRLFVNSLKLLASDSYPSADGQQFNPPKNNYASFLNRVEAGHGSASRYKKRLSEKTASFLCYRMCCLHSLI